MTIKSGFFNSVGGDRSYKADFFAEYFASFIADGVFPNPSTGLQVMANTGMTVNIKAGKAWIKGYYFANDADYTLQLDVADGVLKRIDRIGLRLDFLSREIVPVIIKGTFASSPVAPALQRDADAYEIALADVLINNGAISISQANITDQRLNTTLCGIVHGTVEQADTSTIFNQYLDWFNQTKATNETEFDQFMTDQEAEFTTWFNSIKGQLEGDVAANLANRITELEGDVGDISLLSTADKSNLVNAVNEVKSEAAAHQAEDAIDAHNATNISTTSGQNVQQEIDSLKSSVSDGKNSVEAAIEGKGGAVADTNNPPSFADLVNGVNSIPQAQGNAATSDVLSGKTFTSATYGAAVQTGTMPNRGTFNLGLGASVPAGYYSGGTVPSGKKFASGTETVKFPSIEFFQRQNYSTTGSAYLPYIQVSGLTFTPSVILAYGNKTNTFPQTRYIMTYGIGLNAFNASITDIIFTTQSYVDNSNANIYYYEMGSLNSYVNSSGFRIPVPNTADGSLVMTWVAYE